MGFVANWYPTFVRFHYDDCHHSKAENPKDRWKSERWYDCDTIAEVVDWAARTRPDSPINMCKHCENRHGAGAIALVDSLERIRR